GTGACRQGGTDHRRRERDRAGDRGGACGCGSGRGDQLPRERGGRRGDRRPRPGRGTPGRDAAGRCRRSGGGRGDVHGVRRGVRSARRAGQQRGGGRQRPTAARDPARGVAARAGDEPGRAVPLRGGGGAPDDRRRPGGANRQHLVGPRGGVQRRWRRPLLRGEGGSAESDPRPRVGAGRARHHGQRRGAGDDPDADEPAGAGGPGPPRRGGGADPRPPGGDTGGRGGDGSLPLLRRGLLLHREHLLRRRRVDADVAPGL
ncbi:MAG: 3-oxoacyl-[acyl-carrier protein] reductase, partial [uncultured Thermomicrobiales bacterium]